MADQRCPTSGNTPGNAYPRRRVRAAERNDAMEQRYVPILMGIYIYSDGLVSWGPCDGNSFVDQVSKRHSSLLRAASHASFARNALSTTIALTLTGAPVWISRGAIPSVASLGIASGDQATPGNRAGPQRTGGTYFVSVEPRRKLAGRPERAPSVVCSLATSAA